MSKRRNRQRREHARLDLAHATPKPHMDFRRKKCRTLDELPKKWREVIKHLSAVGASHGVIQYRADAAALIVTYQFIRALGIWDEVMGPSATD